jgi:hypothetical protein
MCHLPFCRKKKRDFFVLNRPIRFKSFKLAFLRVSSREAIILRDVYEHLAGGVKLALIGNNLVNQSGLTFFKLRLQ